MRASLRCQRHIAEVLKLGLHMYTSADSCWDRMQIVNMYQDSPRVNDHGCSEVSHTLQSPCDLRATTWPESSFDVCGKQNFLELFLQVLPYLSHRIYLQQEQESNLLVVSKTCIVAVISDHCIY
jgi:hypothetical protein